MEVGLRAQDAWQLPAVPPLRRAPHALPSSPPRCSLHMLRMDAAGHVRPEFWPQFVNQTDLVAWLETGGDVPMTAEYEKSAYVKILLDAAPGTGGCCRPCGLQRIANRAALKPNGP